MRFHEYLKTLRVSREFGLREFAHKIEMDVGNYSKLENGSHGAPQKEETLQKITKALSLDKEHKEKLFGLAAIANGKIPSDVVEDIKDYEYLPVLLRTIANKQLTDEQLKELTERINKEL